MASLLVSTHQTFFLEAIEQLRQLNDKPVFLWDLPLFLQSAKRFQSSYAWDVVEMMNSTKGLDKFVKLFQYGAKTAQACMENVSAVEMISKVVVANDMIARAGAMETQLNRARKTMRLFKFAKEFQSLGKNLTSTKDSWSSYLINVGSDVSNVLYYLIDQCLWTTDNSVVRVSSETREKLKDFKGTTALFRLIFRFLAIVSTPAMLREEERKVWNELAALIKAKAPVAPLFNSCTCSPNVFDRRKSIASTVSWTSRSRSDLSRLSLSSCASNISTLTLNDENEHDDRSSVSSEDEDEERNVEVSTIDGTCSNIDEVEVPESPLSDADETPEKAEYTESLDVHGKLCFSPLSKPVPVETITTTTTAATCAHCQYKAYMEQTKSQLKRLAEQLRLIRAKKYAMALDMFEWYMNFVLLGSQRNWFSPSSFIIGLCGMGASVVALYRMWLQVFCQKSTSKSATAADTSCASSSPTASGSSKSTGFSSSTPSPSSSQASSAASSPRRSESIKTNPFNQEYF